MAILTLAEFKTYVGISDTSEDNQLNPMIDMINDLIPELTERTLEETAYENELYDGSATTALNLNNYPIVSIEEVLVYNTEIEVVSYSDRVETGTDGYWIKDAENGVLYRNAGWPIGRGVISISYTAGYDTIPNNLKYAALQAASYLRKVGKKVGLASESLGSYSYSLISGAMNGKSIFQNAGVQEIIDAYTRVDIGMGH
jgi:Phage gp6-like head-tail connector protein